VFNQEHGGESSRAEPKSDQQTCRGYMFGDVPFGMSRPVNTTCGYLSLDVNLCLFPEILIIRRKYSALQNYKKLNVRTFPVTQNDAGDVRCKQNVNIVPYDAVAFVSIHLYSANHLYLFLFL